jgi:hypothetical protein
MDAFSLDNGMENDFLQSQLGYAEKFIERPEDIMDDFLKQALEIVKAQASVRTMTEEEITSMVTKQPRVAKYQGGVVQEEEARKSPLRRSQRHQEKSIVCLESW